jgi:UDP-N-acetylmuramate dehydrogenase
MKTSFHNNYPLEQLNTFHISATAKLFYEFEDEKSLIKILKNDILKKEKLLILGGGSNILITEDFNGIVLKNSIKGIKIIDEDTNKVQIEVGSGVNWHDFVMWSVNRNLSGIENLALIPGLVGASPIQNIGAYGMEVKNSITDVHYIEIENKTKKILSNNECNFSYRNSIFKCELKDKVIITKVIFQLSKKNLNQISYGAIKSELKLLKEEPSCKTICKAVINIRTKKLPDPNHLGNSGSFFKNPIISNNVFNDLKIQYPEIIGYKHSKSHTKVAAGWLIDKAGWKGYKEKNVGVYKKQALVLVNYGGANGQEILKLAKKIKESVFNKFKIRIHPEINII